MPKSPLPATIAEFLSRPNPAVIASNRPDGQPVSVATWYLYENGRILVNLAEVRKRLEYLATDPRVSLTIFDGDFWGSHVSVQGRVVSTESDLDLVDIDRIAKHYVDSVYSPRNQGRISCWIEIDRWHAWGDAAELVTSNDADRSNAQSADLSKN